MMTRAAAAGMLPVALQVVAVVEGDLFAGCNRATRDDPDAAADVFRVAVRLTTVIDQAGWIPINAAVEIPGVVEVEDEKVVRRAAFE